MRSLNPKIKKLSILGFGGLSIAGFMLWNASGKFGLSEIIVLFITALIIFGILLFLNKIATKNNE